jgi:hypothetical protein
MNTQLKEAKGKDVVMKGPVSLTQFLALMAVAKSVIITKEN